jgi:hypothetical protein
VHTSLSERSKLSIGIASGGGPRLEDPPHPTKKTREAKNEVLAPVRKTEYMIG